MATGDTLSPHSYKNYSALDYFSDVPLRNHALGTNYYGDASELFAGDSNVIVVNKHHILPRDVFLKFRDKLYRTKPLRIVWVIILILFVTTGNAMQIIGLNFWLNHFPHGGAPGNFTTLAISGLLFGVFFLVMLAVYIIVKRPSISFARSARGWRLIFLIGLMDMINSLMAIYAASYTPEVLQALFTSLVPIYAAGCTKWILRDPRSYMNGWIVTSFFLIVTGVVVASASQFTHGFTDDLENKNWWILVFFFSVPPTVLMNIWQSLYMIEFTYNSTSEPTRSVGNNDGLISVDSCERFPVNSGGLGGGNLSSRKYQKVDNGADREGAEPKHVEASPVTVNVPPTQGMDTIVKLVMLAGETNIQFILIILALPMDALPWWGGSDSVMGAWKNFSDGVMCIFRCENNFLFCIVYTIGFVFTYVGSAYLNQYSVTLCSMIGQLSSPFTALLLIVIPSWNLEKGYTPWYTSLLAIVLLSVGSFIYALWEEKTEEEKVEGERKLKQELLELNPHVH